MECTQCGKDIPINLQFCSYCGVKVEVDFETIRQSITVDLAGTRGQNLRSVMQTAMGLFVLCNVLVFLLNDYYRTDIHLGLVDLPALEAPSGRVAPLARPKFALSEEPAPLALPVLANVAPQRLSHRRGKLRQRLMARRGGSAEAEKAVRMGLEYLASRQKRRGRAIEGYVSAQASQARLKWADTALTGLVALAFLADGHIWVPDPRTGASSRFAQNVKSAIHWLVYHQKRNGQFGPNTPKIMTQHGIATLAVVEAYAMAGDVFLGEAAQKGIDFIVRAQHADGGWHYMPDPNGTTGETSLGGWQIMALTLGRRMGLRVPQKTLERAAAWLNQVTNSTTGAVGDIEPPKSRGELSRPIGTTAVALMSRLALGETLGRGVNARAIKMLLKGENLPRWDKEWRSARLTRGRLDMYYLYHATVALSMVGGDVWQTWNNQLQTVLVARMVRTGRRGRWPPVGLWGRSGGSVYSTAMAVLSLTAPHRDID